MCRSHTFYVTTLPTWHVCKLLLIDKFLCEIKMIPSLSCVHKHYSLLIDKVGRACRNISIQFPCVPYAYHSVISSISGKSFYFPFPYFVWLSICVMYLCTYNLLADFFADHLFFFFSPFLTKLLSELTNVPS